MTDPRKWKIVLDPVHGVVQLDPVAVQIIDTKEFQRLRFIKQLGCTDYVYPGATHTRFAHSIGVYYLACKMIDGLKSVGITTDNIIMEDWEEDCIRIAALCHDLGHGPFSHIYEEMCQESYGQECRWKHQDLSCRLVKRIFKNHPEILGTLTKEDRTRSIRLIMRLIMGKKLSKMTNDEKKRAYIFQIVTNKENSIDVDMWDYLCRDAMYCGMNERFLSERAIMGARVVLTSIEPLVHQIGYPEKDAWMFYNMFQTRITLHRCVYQHRVIVSMNLMLKDIFKASGSESAMQGCDVFKISPHPLKVTTKIPDEDNQLDTFIESCADEDETNRYMKLTDDIISPIRYINGQNDCDQERSIVKAVKLMQDIDNRKFYKMHRELHLRSGIGYTDANRAKDDCIKTMEGKIDKFPEKVAVVLICFDYGMGDRNPMDKVTFYNKRTDDSNSAIYRGNVLPKDKVSHLLADVFSDYYIRIYVKTEAITANIAETITELARKYDTGAEEAEMLYRRVEALAISGN